MNEELTREVLEAMTKCSETSCSECPAVDVCCSEDDITVGQRLATALLEERAKRKNDVWEYAAVQTDRVVLSYYAGDKFWAAKTYTRELPKTRARQIAEQEGQGLAKKNGWSVAAGALVTNVIESALNKYAEELTKKETN